MSLKPYALGVLGSALMAAAARPTEATHGADSTS
jgi:hypothetical protein